MVAVCIPTYNERENLPLMVDAVERELAATGRAWRLLVIDDSSPDGTGRIADQLARNRPWLDVMHRARKDGIGPAYLAAFEKVLETDAQRIVQLDCDFSHDPADLGRLLDASVDADLVIGSRYVAGGAVQRWGLGRRAISRAGCAYARRLLGSPVSDLTSGYRCYRRHTVEAIDLATITSRGYAFQIEMACRVERAGLSIVEIPIVFDERRAGGSKLSRSIVLEAAWRVPALRLAPRSRVLRSYAGRPAVYTRAMSELPEVTDATFDAEVTQSSQPVVVDFWAPWCGPCKAVAPILEEMAQENSDVKFFRLNVDENQKTAINFSVLSIPTVILFEGGEAKETVVGARPKSHFEKTWAPWLSQAA